MSIYLELYNKLCASGVNRKELWRPKSGYHRHHIEPRHSGGLDDETNYSYLSVREHRIAHYLLWKIRGNVNDLRSYYMLGGNLTPTFRSIIGKWCAENGIGFHGASKDERRIWAARGAKAQKERGIGIHNPVNFKSNASLGGKASIVSTNNPWSYWASAEGRKIRASMGGKSHAGKRAMHRPGDISFIRVTPDEIEKYLAEGFVLGSPISPGKGKKLNKPSPKRKRCTDGSNIFDSLKAAAEFHEKHTSQICFMLKSERFPNWKYLSDDESLP
jgi:hypothetical protein